MDYRDFRATAPPPPPDAADDRLKDALDALKESLDALADCELPVSDLGNGVPQEGSRWASPRYETVLYDERSALARDQAAERMRKRAQNQAFEDLYGIGDLDLVTPFVTSIRQLQAQWPNLDASGRLAAIKVAGDVALAAVEVPVVGFITKPRAELPGTAQLRADDWQLALREDLLERDLLSNARAAALANATFHECRHAEQIFLAARFAAAERDRWGRGKSASAIADELRLKPSIASEAASRTPLGKRRTQPKIFAARMYQAYVADWDANQKKEAKLPAAQKALREKWEEAFKLWGASQNLPTYAAKIDAVHKLHRAKTALASQRENLSQEYGRYREIAYEHDAHVVGDTAWVAFRRLVVSEKGDPDADE